MVWVQQIWFGKVDRLSSAANAMVEGDDIWAPDGRSPPHRGEINLGPLPDDIVDDEVVFAYDGGTYGICIQEEWITAEYIDEMEEKTGIDINDIDFRDVTVDDEVKESVSEGATLVAESFLRGSSANPTLGIGSDSMLARLRSLTEGEDWSCIGMVVDPFSLGSLPMPVTVIEVHDTHLEARAALTEVEGDLPRQGETVTVTTAEVMDIGTLALYETDYDIPVLIPDAEYPIGEELKVQITAQKQSHLTGEVPLDRGGRDTIRLDNTVSSQKWDSSQRVVQDGIPIDIRSVPTDSPDTDEIVVVDEGDDALVARWNVRDAVGGVAIEAGDVIELEIKHVADGACIGFHGEFPVRCECASELPPECEGERIKVTVQTVTADRATATPTVPSDTTREWEVRVVGTTADSASAIADTYEPVQEFG